MLIAAALFLALALPLMLGYILSPAPSPSPRQTLAWRFLIGFAGVIVIITYAGAAMGSDKYATWVALAIAAFFLLLHDARSAFIKDLRYFLPRVAHWPIALLAAAVVFFTLWPILGPHHYVNFGGGYNNDNYLYAANVEYVQHHDYMPAEPPAYVADHPIFRFMYQFVGWHVIGGRLGAESYAAFIGSLTHLDALHIYQVVYASGYIFWLAAFYLFIKAMLRDTCITPRAAWIFFAVLQPFFVFFFANGNFANFFGIFLAAAVVVRLRDHVALPPPRSFKGLLHIAILTNALFAVYPELIVPTFGFVAFCLLQKAWQRQWEPFVFNALQVGGALLLGAALNPINSIRGVRGMISSAAAVSSSNPPPDIMHDLHLGQLVPSLFSMFAQWIYDVIPVSLAWGLTVVLVLTLALGIWRARDRWLAGIPIFFFLVQWTAVELAHYGYGHQKTVQYWSIYLVSLLALGIMAAMEMVAASSARFLPARFRSDGAIVPPPFPFSVFSIPRFIFLFAAAGSLAWLTFLMPTELRIMYAFARAEHIDRTLNALTDSLPPGRSIFLRVETFPHDYMHYYANFLPLALKDYPCYYPPVGPPQAYIDETKEKRIAALQAVDRAPDYLLYGPAQNNELLLLHPRPIVTTPEFTLAQPAAHAFLYSGQFGLEPTGRWMSDTLVIDALNTQPAALNVTIDHRYEALPPASEIAFSVDGQKTLVPLVLDPKGFNDHASFSIPLGKPGSHRIEIHSLDGAVVPLDVHLSRDPRALSYFLTRLSLDDEAAFPATQPGEH